MSVQSPGFEAWLEAFARESASEESAQAFVAVVDNEILSQIPEIAEDPVLVDELHKSTRHQWLSWVGTATQPDHKLALPVQAADLARSLARRGKDITVLLKVYRAAHRGVFAYFSQVVDGLTENDPPRDEVLKFVWNRADLWVDDSVEALMETFYEERQRMREGSVARRAEMIEAIVDGAELDADEATTALGHPLLRHQVAFVLWSEESEVGTTEALLSTAGDVANALGSPHLLTHVVGSRDLWSWVATTGPADLGLLTDVAAGLEGTRLHVAAGVPAAGVTGFRSGHQEARAVQSLVLAGATLPAFTPYGDVELLCVTGARGDFLARLVEREAGPLIGEDRGLDQLRETVLTFLTSRMNVEATAEKLFVHKNTVRYRISRAEELLGRPLAERAAQLEIALRHVAAFGG